MNTVYIALGSNIQPMVEYLRRSIVLIKALPDTVVINQSHVYQTAPKGYIDQADFYNMVIEIHTKLSPERLLTALHQIEHHLHRKRLIPNGPRTIDLDILLYEQCVIETPTLIIPHPRLHERAFVLVPLNELTGTYHVPNKHHTVEELLKQLPPSEKLEVTVIGRLETLDEHL